MAEVIVKSAVFEIPPPGDGFVTTTGNVPAVARSEAFSVVFS